MAATTCIHGFAPGQCLICQTLDGGGAGDAGRGRPTKQAEQDRGRPAVLTARPTPVRPDAVLTSGTPRRRSLAWSAVVVVVIVALVALVAVWIIGVVFAVLRIVELVAAGLVAGWIGYHVGLYRGRRQKPAS
jgi:hypothetical protein